MSIKTDDIFVEYECDECGNKITMSVDEIITGGNPVCRKCASPLEMEATDKVFIPELGI